ncbi:hypothetical protein F2Q69_00024037 [Brassica cretica]|uniref:Uncharacterized protein n=1 Tax=Brassica cretica TaxID=69181 RepID=A0A8S9QGS3_BRACR|nr:hypothetical protein F2Q69_00024037 [Brassica cretica]
MRVPSKSSSIKSSLTGCSKGRSGLRESFKERIVEIQLRLCGQELKNQVLERGKSKNTVLEREFGKGGSGKEDRRILRRKNAAKVRVFDLLRSIQDVMDLWVAGLAMSHKGPTGRRFGFDRRFWLRLQVRLRPQVLASAAGIWAMRSKVLERGKSKNTVLEREFGKGGSGKEDRRILRRKNAAKVRVFDLLRSIQDVMDLWVAGLAMSHKGPTGRRFGFDRRFWLRLQVRLRPQVLASAAGIWAMRSKG